MDGKGGDAYRQKNEKRRGKREIKKIRGRRKT
jgi:hypothetical protein